MDILIVEDNPSFQKIMEKILGKMGHQTILVDNGQLAIEALFQNTFDFIFMDLEMPIKNGFETTQELVGLGCEVPIVAITSQEIAKEECFKIGMVDFITKPFTKDQIQRVLNQWTQDL